ncbi:hypothetical protein Tco_0240332 [Tanacetum coccineum]
MNILCLEYALAERLGLGELQPHVDQLMIRDNIANYRSALCDVFIPLAEPFSDVALEGTKGTSNAVIAAATTTALSTTLVSTSTVNPISIDDYEVVEEDDQVVSGINDASFPNMDDVDFHISQ